MSRPSYAHQRLSSQIALSASQRELVEKVFAFSCRGLQKPGKHVFVIEGAAGTGKTMVMNRLFSLLQKNARDKASGSALYGTRNFLLVNHAEMMKLYKGFAREDPWLRQKDFVRPTSFINGMDKKEEVADIVLIDEAHLLLTQPHRYTKFMQDNQLQEIIRLSRCVILVFDPGQVLKFRSHWTPQLLQDYVGSVDCQYFHLDKQFRMGAPAGVLDWIEDFCFKRKLKPLPASSFIEVFEDAQDMYEKIRQMDRRYGLCRMIATYDYYYRLDGKRYYIEEGRFKLPWDMSLPQATLPWAERPQTLDEVGSVYTIQGFDLNYAGVIIGPSITLGEDGVTLDVDPALYEDDAAFYGGKKGRDMTGEKIRIMMNALYVLMTRPVHGLFIYAHDPKLRKRLLTLRTQEYA